MAIKHTPSDAKVRAAFLKMARRSSEDPMVRAADALADALEGFLRAHAEDGCCGPGAGKKPDLPRGTTDYCDACTAGRAALRKAGRIP